jgi:hypothetical protein
MYHHPIIPSETDDQKKKKAFSGVLGLLWIVFEFITTAIYTEKMSLVLMSISAPTEHHAFTCIENFFSSRFSFFGTLKAI